MTTTLSEPILETRHVPRAKPRRFGLAFLLSFIFVWSAVLLIHFLGNPDGIFPSPRNPSRRELPWKARQFDRLIKQGHAPSVLVLGSSRMMQVYPPQMDQLTGSGPGQTYNFTAPGCTPQDMLAQLRFALARGAPIKHVLIGVDDQAMFSIYDQSHETRIAAVPPIFRTLPAFEQLRIALRLPAQVKPELTPNAIQAMIDPPDPRDMRLESATTLILEDGYLIYPRRSMERRAKTWDPRKALQRTIKGLHDMGDRARLYPNGARISARHMQALRDLLSLCRKQKINVRVILTPVQRDFAQLTLSSADRAMFRELSGRLRKLCRQQGAVYLDFSRIENFKGKQWEWINFTHPLTENVRRMINVAYGKPAEYRLNEMPDDFSILRNPPRIHSMNTP